MEQTVAKAPKHIFIVNPVSGKRQYKKTVALIEKQFNDPNDYEIVYTEYVGHAKEIAQKYRGDYRLYAVGGDGTAHEILNGLNEGVEFAIIPVGSGNDFVRMYIHSKDIEKIIRGTIHGEASLIDIGLANDERFLNCLNIGLDAEVNVRVNKIQNRIIPRQFVYIYAALIEIFVNCNKKLSTF